MLRRALDGGGAATVVAGHTHMQFDRRVDGKRWINAGSVGMPYQGDVAAFWALLGPGVELRRTAFDVAAAAAAIQGETAGPRQRDSSRTTWSAQSPGNRPSPSSSSSPPSAASGERPRVLVGRVGCYARPARGAFVVERPSESPGRYAVGATLLAGGEPAKVVESKMAGNRRVIRLDRRVERGVELEVARDALPEPEADAYYVFQLVGLAVEEEGGRALGRVVEVVPRPANDVLEHGTVVHRATDGRGLRAGSRSGGRAHRHCARLRRAGLTWLTRLCS